MAPESQGWFTLRRVRVGTADTQTQPDRWLGLLSFSLSLSLSLSLSPSLSLFLIVQIVSRHSELLTGGYYSAFELLSMLSSGLAFTVSLFSSDFRDTQLLPYF